MAKRILYHNGRTMLEGTDFEYKCIPDSPVGFRTPESAWEHLIRFTYVPILAGDTVVFPYIDIDRGYRIHGRMHVASASLARNEWLSINPYLLVGWA